MACTDSGRCCSGSNCTVTKQCLCNCKSGSSFTVGGACDTGVCLTGNTCASGVTVCACSSGSFVAGATCDCRTYPWVCNSTNCYSCNSSTGVCYYNCPSPRICCSGTCCLESQYCSSSTCINRCASGERYCRTSLSPYAFTCCPSGQDCCNGVCTATTQTSTVLYSSNLYWVSTSITLTASQYLTITSNWTMTYSDSGGTVVVASPDGNDAMPLPALDTRFTKCAVIGYVGTGDTFKIGSSWSGSPGAGSLYLGFNIESVPGGTLSGSFVVIVKVHGCDPGAAPLEQAIVFQHFSPPAQVPDGGPGTELKNLLRYMGIVATPNCSCNARAAEMDQKEMEFPGWCEANMDTILGWLQEQAQNRGLPFIRPAAKLLVKRAISLAKRKSAKKGISR